MQSKRIKFIFVLVMSLQLILSACTSLPQTTEPAATETPSFTPTPAATPQPTLEAGWTAKTIIDETSALHRLDAEEEFSGLLIEGSQVFADVDMCWNVTFNFENLDPTVGLTGAGILISSAVQPAVTPTLHLGTDDNQWTFGYAPLYMDQFEIMENLESVSGLEQSFQICIKDTGKTVELINGQNIVYSHSFSDPIFPKNMELAAYTQVGPHASINVTALSIERHEGMDNSAYLAQTVNPALGFRFF